MMATLLVIVIIGLSYSVVEVKHSMMLYYVYFALGISSVAYELLDSAYLVFILVRGNILQLPPLPKTADFSS